MPVSYRTQAETLKRISSAKNQSKSCEGHQVYGGKWRLLGIMDTTSQTAMGNAQLSLSAHPNSNLH